MKLAKSAVGYYTQVTGNAWSKFYDDLDIAMSGNLDEQQGDLWLIHALMNTLIKNGVSIEDFKMNKDAVKAVFDEEGRKLNGEFFTPVIWAEELHRYMDEEIPNWRETYNVWENSCYDIDTYVLIRRRYNKITDIRETLESFDVDVICYGDKGNLSKSEAPKYNNIEWIYDTGFTLIARISAKSLKPDDEVLTMNPETGELSWSGYHDLFFKKSNTMISFTFGSELFDFQTTLKVTPDHRMLVRFDGDTSFKFITASNLITKLETTTCYMRLRNGIDVKIDSAKEYNNIEVEVWDLTTNNDNHCFCVHPKLEFGGVDVISGNCGSGNLIRTARINPDHLFASSLQQDDITLIKNTPELAGCHAFQLDFLNRHDDFFGREFVDNLPEELQKIIKNDEPLIFLCNPPYKTGQANNTEVGKYMNNNISYFNHVNFAKPAYDLFYQFCFQMMNIAALHKLTNCYVCIFGPLTWFTGAGANILLKEFERVFEFKRGMCISAQEFSDTSDSILWGIGATIWKSRGGYMSEADVNYHKDILLDKKFIAPDGTIGCEGKVLYAPPRKKLSTWVHSDDKAVPKKEFPLMTSHLTFKGGDVFEKIAHKTAKMRDDAWGILMSQDTMTRSSDQSAVMSVPSTIQYEPIVEENFWRAVASYTFRRIYEADWSIAKKDISAPDVNVDGYDLWLKNAIPLFLFEYKSMMASLRGIVREEELNQPEDARTKITIRNNFFFLSPEEVRAHCTDPVILKDLEENPQTEGQKFMLKVIEECEPYWAPEVRQLYDWCKAYTLATYDLRKTVNYKGSLECWDAGFQQLRSGLWNAEKLDVDMTKLLVQARDYMRKDISKFGFVSEVQNGDL